jgi:hypothetical protein
MTAVPVNYLAVFVAAVAGFVTAWIWYAILGNSRQRASGKTEMSDVPAFLPFAIAFLANLLMAYLLAGLVGHMQDVTLRGAIVTALFIWAGFIATTMLVNHQFQGVKPIVTAIDAGSWLAVLIVMAIVIGLFGV